MHTIWTKDGPSDNEQSRDDGLPTLQSIERYFNDFRLLLTLLNTLIGIAWIDDDRLESCVHKT